MVSTITQFSAFLVIQFLSLISMKEFCRRKEINPSTFDGWLNRFYPDREKKTNKRQTAMVKIQAAGLDGEFLMEYKGARTRIQPSIIGECVAGA